MCGRRLSRSPKEHAAGARGGGQQYRAVRVSVARQARWIRRKVESTNRVDRCQLSTATSQQSRCRRTIEVCCESRCRSYRGTAGCVHGSQGQGGRRLSRAYSAARYLAICHVHTTRTSSQKSGTILCLFIYATVDAMLQRTQCNPRTRCELERNSGCLVLLNPAGRTATAVYMYARNARQNCLTPSSLKVELLKGQAQLPPKCHTMVRLAQMEGAA
jgi:hypothetical protein